MITTHTDAPEKGFWRVDQSVVGKVFHEREEYINTGIT